MTGDDFITVEQAASLLHVSKWTIYDAINSGEAPWAGRIGRAIRIHKPTLLKAFSEAQPAPAKKARRR
jgi:excisionase family DNA binding protein